jgi:GMP synthase-like glutamine amidotransferase
VKPVWIFVHHPVEGPGRLAEFFAQQQIPYELIPVWDGADVPSDLSETSGLVFMGGPMSVHDSLPWIALELDLIRYAHAQGIPILGHCLGAQLITLALGGAVFRGPAQEIGWLPIDLHPQAESHSWFGKSTHATVFHWHGEQCSLPAGATRLASTAITENQAFALGNTLAVQFHLEMEADMVKRWCTIHRQELDEALQRLENQASVQKREVMLAQTDAALSKLNPLAHQVYAHWTSLLQPAYH